MSTLRILLASAVFSLHAHGATITEYQPTRDTFMRGGLSDLHGSTTNGRASKAFLDFYIADFDREVIRNSIEGLLGRTLTSDDMLNVELAWHLFSNDFQGYQPTALSRPAVFIGAQDWIEGTNATFGATKGFALYDPLDSSRNEPWRNSAGNEVPTFLALDRIENRFFEEWGGEPYTYRRWVLDPDVAFAYLTDPLALGLFLNASDAGNLGNDAARYNNTEIFSRDTTNLARRPFLQVTIVPEPKAAATCIAGALLLVTTRKRGVHRPLGNR